MTDLSIQIVNYNTKSHLLTCLDSLFADLQGASFSYEVRVLDNASQDDLSDLPACYRELPLVVWRNGRNVGFGAGHNILARGSLGERLLFLNPDTRLSEPRTVARLLEAHQGGAFGIIGPRLLDEAGQTQPWDHGDLHGWRARLMVAIGLQHWQTHNSPLDVAWVSGAALLISRALFLDQLGGFDERFFLFMEEIDLCLRVRQRGGRVRYHPTVSLAHRGGVVARRNQHAYTSAMAYTNKHFKGRPTYYLSCLFNRLLRRFVWDRR